MRTATKSVECAYGCGSVLQATATGPNRKVQRMAWDELNRLIVKDGWKTSVLGEGISLVCRSCHQWINDPPVGKEII